MEGTIEAYGKVQKCIETSMTVMHLETCNKMLSHFITHYDVDVKFKHKLMRALSLKKCELFEKGQINE